MPKDPDDASRLDEDDTYKIGWGKPPKHSQWKPNQSGNPAGRKRGSLSKKTLSLIAAHVLLDDSVTIKERGRQREVSKLEGLVRILANLGLQGDRRAIVAAFALVDRFSELEEPASECSEESSIEDAAILERFGVGLDTSSAESRHGADRDGAEDENSAEDDEPEDEV